MTILLENEILRVTTTGEFIWHEDADRMIEEGDFSNSPAMPYILKALRKREWVGLTEEEFSELLYFGGRLDHVEVPLIADLIRTIQAKLKEKNT